jgi:hypothetical protein
VHGRECRPTTSHYVLRKKGIGTVTKAEHLYHKAGNADYHVLLKGHGEQHICRRMISSGELRLAAVVRTDVLEERSIFAPCVDS